MARRRYQKGTLRKRGKRNPVWELIWREDFIKPDGGIGRRLISAILGPVGGMTRRQAMKAAEDILRPLNQGKMLPQSAITFADFVDRYFVPHGFPTLKLSTQRRYRQTLNTHLLPAFGHSKLCEIRALDPQRFVLQKMEQGLGWEAANHFRNLMSKIFATAKKWGFHSGENPASGVELPEKKPVREKHILEPPIIPRLVAALEEPVRTMVLLALLTGLRVGEILALRWKDVDFTSGVIRVEQSYYRGITGSPKTKGSRRTLPLCTALRDALLAFRGLSVPMGEALAFQTAKGTPYSDTNLLHRFLKPAGRRLGIPWLNWHTMRRTHATLFQVAGGSLRDAQAQLGHSKASTTLEIYTLPIPTHQREAVEKLSELLTNVGELASPMESLTLPTQRIQ